MSKVYNFFAGPATLPEAVLRQAQAEFMDYHGIGYSLITASHRGKAVMAMVAEAKADIKALLGLDDDHSILFLQGGASMQFAMIPLNLMFESKSSAYVDTGTWSSKAIKEAKILGDVKVVASSKATNYDRIPAFDTWESCEKASYLHITSNNTIAGTQYAQYPKVNVPLIADMSSDILSRQFDANQFGLIYAGAQKNIGPSGVTLVIIRNDLLARTPSDLLTMFKYTTHVAEDSMYNTPPVFPIYIVGLTVKWIREQGGLAALEAANEKKAALLYGMIRDGGYYRSPVQPGSESKMNVVFRLPSEKLEAKFMTEATAAGFVGLEGHRSVGGCRASIYNAMPYEGVQALVDFMAEFRTNNG